MPTEKFLTGTVLCYYEDKKFGYILDEKNIRRHFHLGNIQGEIIPHTNDHVMFIPSNPLKGPKAIKIQILKTDFKSRSKKYKYLISSILKNWKIEARNEDIIKYFYHPSELNMIYEFDKCFVIGRKGTGKTAVSEYLFKNNSSNCQTYQMSFKDFPYNELYNFNDSKYTLENQYITLWKLIIYGKILEMMSKNERIDTDLVNYLRNNMFPVDDVEKLDKSIKSIIEEKSSFNFYSIKFEKERKFAENSNYEWSAKVNIYEDLILRYIDNSFYYILIDGLEDDYNVDDKERKYYFSLLKGLCKAVQEIKLTFRDKRYRLKPIIFLRDDIYRQIKDSDKMKWEDNLVQMSWDLDKLKKLIEFRIFKTSNDSRQGQFENEWLKLFESIYVETQKGKKEMIEYISKKTYMRPRDFIQYIRYCCEIAYKNDSSYIKVSYLPKADYLFSQYLKQDIENEARGVLDEITEVFGILSRIQKALFTYNEFCTEYKRSVETQKIIDRNTPEIILGILYEFNVIGNMRKDNTCSFFRDNPMSVVDINQKLLVHRGLIDALQLMF